MFKASFWEQIDNVIVMDLFVLGNFEWYSNSDEVFQLKR